MKCRRAPLTAEVTEYKGELGLEDGFDLYKDVITKNNVNYEKVIKEEHDGEIVCPYIITRRGKNYIQAGDYIIEEEDGTKHVCGGDKVFQRYIPIEDL